MALTRTGGEFRAHRDGDLGSGRSPSKPSSGCQAPASNLNALTVPESNSERGRQGACPDAASAQQTLCFELRGVCIWGS